MPAERYGKKIAACQWLINGLLAAVFLSCLVFLLGGQAMAQAIPNAADAGRLQEEMNDQALSHPPQTVSQETTVEKEEIRAQAPPGADKIFFVLRQIVISGSTAYHHTAFDKYYKDKLNKNISFAEIYHIAAEITQHYARDGYALSHAVVPPQTIENGIVNLTVIEGYVSEVHTEDDYHESSVTQGIIKGILSMRPLSATKLEHEMLMLNDLTGRNVRAVLQAVEKPDPAPGEVAIQLIFDEKPASAVAYANNYGTRYTGPLQLGAHTGLHGVFHPYDQVNLSLLSTANPKEMRFGSIQYKMPLSSEGLMFALFFSANKSIPGYNLKPFELKNTSHSGNAQFSYPLVRSRVEYLFLSSMFAFKDIYSQLLGAELYEDRIRSIRIGSIYSVFDRLEGNTLLDIGLVRGINGLGARDTGSINLSRASGRSDFTKLEATVTRSQILDEIQVHTGLSAQYASVPLLSSEQFGFGGQTFGRGYDPSEITGDSGIAASLEFRFMELSPAQKWGILMQPFVFYDIGRLWNRTPNGTKSVGSAASTGFGVRFTSGEHVSGMLTLAKPLTHDVAAFTFPHRRDPRAFFSLSYRY